VFKLSFRWGSSGQKPNLLSLIGGLFVFLGRPLFYLLVFALFSLLVVLTFLGKIILFLLIRLPIFIAKWLKFLITLITKLRLPKIKIIVPKVRLPKLVLPRIRVSKKLVFCLLLLVSCCLFLVAFYQTILKDLPSPDKLITRDQIVSTKIYDRHGQLLYKIYRQQNRTLVKLEEIPLYLRQATISIEDREFYSHQGLSPRGIVRAVYRNLFLGRLSGGSTITQQLVKNALLTPERTWRRKTKEVVLALWVETQFTKDEILQMYFNEVGYGGAAYGIEEASQLYFGKSVREVDLAEAALLAGLPVSPTRYSPFGAHPELAKWRQEQVLRTMVENKYLTPQQAQEALTQELIFAPQKTDIRAPHFVMYVKDLLVEKYGQKMVEEGGLEVRTSLDSKIQDFAQAVVTQEIDQLKKLRISNGAALVTNPQTGEILAMIGSRDYFDKENDGNYNVTTARRQPGSSIKPVNYSVALTMGFTPATIIPDTPITFRIPGQPPYSPVNYDNRFHGNVPLRIALASSYNVPAVKVLSAIGVSRMIEQGEKMGITTWNEPTRFGLSLTLGGGEVKMTDMAVVYGTLANLGMRVDLNPILEVKDYKGKVLEELKCDGARGGVLLNEQALDPDGYRGVSEDAGGNRRTLALAREVKAISDLSAPCNGIRVLSPQIAYILTDILSDNVARTPAFGPHSVLVIPGYPHVAAKTGTSNNLKDNWTIGYTSDLLVAAWVGNNDASPMSYVASGVTGASPIWHKIMAELLKDKPNKEFKIPEDLVRVEICPKTNTLPCDGCGGEWEYFLPGTEPKNHCSPEQLQPTPPHS
jgi:1A family penicillin-binding protein